LRGKIDDKQYAEIVKNWPGYSIFMRPKEELPDTDYEVTDDKYSRWSIDGYPTSINLLEFIEKNLPVMFNRHYKKEAYRYIPKLPFDDTEQNNIDILIETRKAKQNEAMEKKKKSSKSK